MLNHDAIHWIPGSEGMNQAYLGAIHWKSQIIGIASVEGPLELHQGETGFALKVWAPLFTYPMLHVKCIQMSNAHRWKDPQTGVMI